MSAEARGGEQRCARCDEPFRCGIDDPDGCWCAREFPPLARVPEPDQVGCLCRRCLAEALARAEEDDRNQT